jgi:hypothetical protein
MKKISKSSKKIVTKSQIRQVNTKQILNNFHKIFIKHRHKMTILKIK